MHRGLCHLEPHDTQRTIDYARQSRKTLDQSETRDVAMTSVDLGEAYAQAGEIAEAARLVDVLKKGRAALAPWKNSTAVRELDDRLTTYGLVSALP